MADTARRRLLVSYVVTRDGERAHPMNAIVKHVDLADDGTPTPSTLARVTAAISHEVVRKAALDDRKQAASTPPRRTEGLTTMTDTPGRPRDASGQPELRPGWDDDGNPLNVTDCGWHLSWGCNLSFGRPDPGVEGGPLQVTVAQSGDITQRTVTAEQLVTFGQMLIDLGRSAA